MITLYAKTLKQLHEAVGRLVANHPDAAWHGWDDGSLIVDVAGSEAVSIEPNEPKPPPAQVSYRCSYCGAVRTSSSGAVSCGRCSWRPMMKPVEESSPATKEKG